MASASTPIQLTLAEDGLPANPTLRKLAVQLKFFLTNRGPKKFSMDPKSLIEKRFREADRGDASFVFDGLVSAGTIVKVHGVYQFTLKGFTPGGTPEAKASNYAATARVLGDRLGRTPEARARLSRLFIKIREIYGIHRQRTAEGQLVVFPEEIAIGAGGANCVRATLALIEDRGIKILEAGPDAFGPCSLGETIGSIDLGKCTLPQDPHLQQDLMDTFVSPFTSASTSFTSKTARLMKRSVSSFAGGRGGLEAHVGHSLTHAEYRSFVATLKQVKHLGESVRRVLFSALNLDVRAACIRNPYTPFSTYQWYCGGNDEQRKRRLQASAAFPIFSHRLPKLEAVIDEGLPLTPALCEITGFTPIVLRRLVGMTWQRLGGHHYAMIADADPQRPLPMLLQQVPGDRIPKSRQEWIDIGVAAGFFARNGGFPAQDNTVAAAGQDWSSFAQLVHKGLGDGISDMAKHLRMACTGIMPGSTMLMTHFDTDIGWTSDSYARAILSQLGKQGGSKQLAEFNHRWHATQPWRTAAQRMIRRDILGDDLLSWKPLTRKPFSSQNGTVTWLTDEDLLATEGLQLRHCVGSYSYNCLSGFTHIGSVADKDGNRSTIEILINEDGKPEVVQHRAIWNSEPTDTAKDLANDFISSVAQRKTRIAKPKKASRARMSAGAELRPSIEIPMDLRRQIIGHYGPCLGNARNLTLEQWMDAVAAFQETPSILQQAA